MSEINLFGDPIPKASKLKDAPKGYAATPGSGPKGETCGTCEHICRTQGGGSYFHKCQLQRHRWTHGPGSDIRVSSPACARWEKEVVPTPPTGCVWLTRGQKLRAGDLSGHRGEWKPICKEIVGSRIGAEKYRWARATPQNRGGTV